MSREKQYIPVQTEKATHLKVELYYSKGGMNYFTGNTVRRGLYLSVSPVTLTKYEGGGSSEGYTAFTGTKQLVKELKRFSDKAMNEAVAEFMAEGNEIRENLIKYVCNQNDITLKQPETVS